MTDEKKKLELYVIDAELVEALRRAADNPEQLGGLLGCTSELMVRWTNLDHQFERRLREVASTFPREVAEGFNAQVDAWVKTLAELIDSYDQAVRAVVDQPAGGTLQ